MDGEIILDRRDTNIMKLDDNEQALMNEIEIEVPRHQPVKKQISRMKTQFTPPQPQMFQEDIDSFVNPSKQAQPSAPPREEPIDYGEYEDDEPEMEYGGGGGGGYAMEEEEKPSPGFKTIDEEKADLVNKLGRLEKKGFTVNKRLNAYSPVDELRAEVKRITYSIDVDKSIKFSRRMLIACTTGLEFLNKKYNPFEIQLDGWSENVMENVDDYDEVFEELYVKYRTKMHVAPEVKLIMMLGGSAMMFHLTNSMFKSVMPNMNDVIKQNPELVQNMMSAVQNTVSKSQQQSVSSEPSSEGGGRREMQGPGFDISSLMGNIMMPPQPPMNTTSLNKVEEPEIDLEDDISDIAEPPVSEDVADEDSEVREVKVTQAQTKSKRGGSRKKKTVEINL